MKKQATVYAFYDAYGAPLYVGVTTIGLGRPRSHRSTAKWFEHAATATFEHYDDLQTAYGREAELIKALRPKHNVVGLALPAPQHVVPGTLAARLRDARVAGEWTQQEVADELGVAPRTITRWEAGISEPRARYIRAFAEFVGIAPEDLRRGATA